MPLRQVVVYKGESQGECPLGKFEIDVAGGCGGYTKDPVEACFKCNFSDTDTPGFDLEKICKCPSDMSREEYDKLRKKYSSGEGEKTKKGFQEFVKTNYHSNQPGAKPE